MTTSGGSTTVREAVLRIACPRCGRGVSRACVTAGGSVARRPHAERLRRIAAVISSPPAAPAVT